MSRQFIKCSDYEGPVQIITTNTPTMEVTAQITLAVKTLRPTVAAKTSRRVPTNSAT